MMASAESPTPPSAPLVKPGGISFGWAERSWWDRLALVFAGLRFAVFLPLGMLLNKRIERANTERAEALQLVVDVDGCRVWQYQNVHSGLVPNTMTIIEVDHGRGRGPELILHNPREPNAQLLREVAATGARVSLILNVGSAHDSFQAHWKNEFPEAHVVASATSAEHMRALVEVAGTLDDALPGWGSGSDKGEGSDWRFVVTPSAPFLRTTIWDGEEFLQLRNDALHIFVLLAPCGPIFGLHPGAPLQGNALGRLVWRVLGMPNPGVNRFWAARNITDARGYRGMLRELAATPWTAVCSLHGPCVVEETQKMLLDAANAI